MKKILTLLVMFLATASILTAQTPQPRLNYQMIVRDANNALVYNTTVSGTVNVITTGVTNPVYTKNFSEKTNMNGMLTIILDNQSGSTNLEKIDWANSQFRVKIAAYGIDTTMNIYPVLYAYNVFTDSNITTPRIVKYIEEKAKATSADSIFDAAVANNDGFMAPAQTRVVNILKQNPGMVKDLAIYFLHFVTEEDVEKAYDTIDKNSSDDIVNYIAKKVANYTEQNKSAVFNVVKYYLGNATVADANNLWNAAMDMHNGDDNVDTIIYMIVDSVNKYIAKNKQWIKDVAKYVVSHVEIDDINGMHTLFKTSNNATYEYMKSVLDSLINVYLVENHYLSAKCGDEVITLCDLNEQIEQLKENGFKACPSFGDNNIETFPNVTTPIIPSAEVVLSTNPQDYWYELTFPGTNYPATVVPATLNGNSISANLSNYANRTVEFRPVMKQKCMDVTTYGSYTTVTCTLNVTNPCEKPEIASFTKTGTSVAELASNHGVALTAKLTNNYYGNAMQHGFAYSTDEGATWDTMNTTVNNNDGLTFSDTIKMNLCGKNITVRAFVTDGNGYSKYQEANFKLRDIWLDVEPIATTYNHPVELTATNHIAISTQSYIDELGTSQPSVEQIVAKYGSEFGVNVVPTYVWTNANNVTVDQDAVYNATTAGTYTVTCSFSIFNSAPCVLTKTVTVQ
jgi:hypothetical protein